MAKVHGRHSDFRWNSNVVNGLTDISPSLSREKVDATSHDTGDAMEFIVGRFSGEIQLEGFWNEADTGQGAMLDDFGTGTERAVEMRVQTGGGLHKFTGTGQITAFNITGGNDAPTGISISLTFSGAITIDTQ